MMSELSFTHHLSLITSMTTATAPGKIILVGEHAVVYGQPAIAVPVWQVAATATIVDVLPGAGCTLLAPDVGLCLPLAMTSDAQPLALITRLTLRALALPANPDWEITLHSTIPIASGLGSGAALSAALVRAIYAHVGQPADPATVSALVFESERYYHGTPSGIDNTVIAYGQPIWFVKGTPPIPFAPHCPFTLVIANSGLAAPTKETVGDVRRAWQADPMRYEGLFADIGALVRAARDALEAGQLVALGEIFNQNQALLETVGVSSAQLATLLNAARGAGALGAKLSGGGRGGNIIALVTAETQANVAEAVLDAGAQSVIVTTVA
jgi:mevalonate kinase